MTIVRRGGTDGTWADDNMPYPPGCYNEDPGILYPVIVRSFDSGERDEWVLQHENPRSACSSCGLLTCGFCPRENDVEVVKLIRKADGNPAELLIRAEHPETTCAAKKAAEQMTGF